MAKVPSGVPLRSSVLDRLIGSGGSGSLRAQGLREIKESVRRDLEDLLNTRFRCTSWPSGQNEDPLEESLVNYGIPDFTGVNVGSPDTQEEFRRTIERVIQRYEPRFKRVSVELEKKSDAPDRTLRFRIQALLHADPVPEPVVFDSRLEPVTAHFEIREEGR